MMKSQFSIDLLGGGGKYDWIFKSNPFSIGLRFIFII